VTTLPEQDAEALSWRGAGCCVRLDHLRAGFRTHRHAVVSFPLLFCCVLWHLPPMSAWHERTPMSIRCVCPGLFSSPDHVDPLCEGHEG